MVPQNVNGYIMPSSRPGRARRRPSGHVTIRDVAAHAAVSVATVSRVINSKNVVREETSRHVREIAKSLGYVPNVAARALSIRRSHTIGTLLPDVHGEFFSEVIRGIDTVARAAGYHILVSGWHSDMTVMLDMIAAMRGRVDGLVVMAPDVKKSTLRQKLNPGVPVVLLNSTDEGHDSITIDNYGGARAVIQHLIRLGHEQIAFIAGPSGNNDARERLRGYRSAIRRLAKSESRTLEFPGDFREQSGYDALQRILAATPRPTAIFAANDSMAIGALSALADAGIDVPGGMALVGFDDIPIARCVSPPLTTVHVEIVDLGRRAVARLLESIRSEHPPHHEQIATSLVIRKSCGAQEENKVHAAPETLRERRKGENS